MCIKIEQKKQFGEIQNKRNKTQVKNEDSKVSKHDKKLKTLKPQNQNRPTLFFCLEYPLAQNTFSHLFCLKYPLAQNK